MHLLAVERDDNVAKGVDRPSGLVDAVSLVGFLLPVQVTITIVKQFFYEVVFHHVGYSSWAPQNAVCCPLLEAVYAGNK